MANYNKVTVGKFMAIKALLKDGATVKEVMEYLQVSEPVVYGCKKVDTYEDYVNARTVRELERKQVAAIKAKEKEQAGKPAITDDKQKGGTISANYQINRIYDILRQINETMTIMSNKLGFVVDELTK